MMSVSFEVYTVDPDNGYMKLVKKFDEFSASEAISLVKFLRKDHDVVSLVECKRRVLEV